MLNGHQTSHHQQLQQPASEGGPNGGAPTSAMGNGVASLLTEKQQQQIERNNYLMSLTKDQLKTECRKRGQKTSGTKTELVFHKI